MEEIGKLEKNLAKISVGLNIEGCRPVKFLPKRCKWWNIIQVIDNPYLNITFDDILRICKENNYKYLEQAVKINVSFLIELYAEMIEKAKKKYKNVLVHVHQYQNTTILHEQLSKKCGVPVITDITNFYDKPTNYAELYPDIDLLISISQCAGIGTTKPGSFIIPDYYFEIDLSSKMFGNINSKSDNLILQDGGWSESYIAGNLIVVSDLWNPRINISNEKLTRICNKQIKLYNYIIMLDIEKRIDFLLSEITITDYVYLHPVSLELVWSKDNYVYDEETCGMDLFEMGILKDYGFINLDANVIPEFTELKIIRSGSIQGYADKYSNYRFMDIPDNEFEWECENVDGISYRNLLEGYYRMKVLKYDSWDEIFNKINTITREGDKLTLKIDISE